MPRRNSEPSLPSSRLDCVEQATSTITCAASDTIRVVISDGGRRGRHEVAVGRLVVTLWSSRGRHEVAVWSYRGRLQVARGRHQGHLKSTYDKPNRGC